ncbi:MAG: acyltransferase [Rhizobiaceae bacterium]|nr:acyltransferase [Rhizobiaceae bacterium]
MATAGALQGPYRPELDGIRAICIIFTVAEHLPGKPWMINGSVGVDVFFALSGWLITWLLIHDRNENRQSKLVSYYIRRAFRILPLYVLTIIFYGLAATALWTMTGDPTEFNNFWTGFPYFATFNTEYMHMEDGTLFGHAWTLGIEEKFYIIWPFIMIFLFDVRAIGIAAAVAALLLLISIGPNTDLLIRGYAGLSFGAGLAVAASGSKGLGAVLEYRAVAYLALVGIVAAYICSLAFPHRYLWNVCISFSAAGLVGSLWLQQGRTHLARALSVRPLAGLGRLTYAIYLIHVLVMNVILLVLDRLNIAMPWLVAFALCYAASIVASFVLHRVVEVPLIEIGRGVARRYVQRRPAQQQQALRQQN